MQGLLRSFTPLPTACALRLRVISVRGADFTFSALIPNLDAQDGIGRACADSFLELFSGEVERR
jgi:hypothetical protein